MNPADKRVMDLLDRWLTSIELHLKYADLDETRYNQVQPWPVHERPARWLLELSQQKVLQLKTLCKARLAENDPSFAESLELMCFLANLVGAQHVQRFIPLADPARESKATLSAPLVAPTAEPGPTTKPAAVTPPKPQTAPAPPATPVLANGKATTPARDPADTDRTREMPRLKQAAKRAPAPLQATKGHDAAMRKPAAKPTPPAKPVESANNSNGMNDIVVADAVRLLRWGRQWHELAELIARMAERPALAEVRRILRSHKASIESQLTN
jgi:hypothetical protein